MKTYVLLAATALLTLGCADLLGADGEDDPDFIADLIGNADHSDRSAAWGDLSVGGSCNVLGDEIDCDCYDGSTGTRICRSGGLGACICEAELTRNNGGRVRFPGSQFTVYSLEPPPPAYTYPDPPSDDDRYRAPVAFLPLETLDDDLSLSANFTLRETAQVEKGPYAVVQPHALLKLQAIRRDLGAIRINSGYRSPHYNEGLNGATYSRHMYGDAFDFTPEDATLSEAVTACQRAGASFIKEYDFHVHCDWRDGALEEAFFGADLPFI